MFGGEKVVFPCFKQLPLNIKQKFEFLYNLIDGERLLSVVVVVSFSIDKPLDFHHTSFSVSPSLKYSKVLEVLTKVVLYHC